MFKIKTSNGHHVASHRPIILLSASLKSHQFIVHNVLLEICEKNANEFDSQILMCGEVSRLKCAERGLGGATVLKSGDVDVLANDDRRPPNH